MRGGRESGEAAATRRPEARQVQPARGLLASLMLALATAPAIGSPEATQTAAEEIPLSNPGFEHGGRRNRAASWERIAGWDSVSAG